MDGLTPECETEDGCLVPAVDQKGLRVLEMRSLLVQLRPLVDPGTVLRMCDADLDDLKLLAIIEAELQPEPPKED